MQDTALQLDVPEQDTHGIWPWLVGITAAVLMLITIAQQLQHIPGLLLAQARSKAILVQAEGVEIRIDGRDLLLGGTFQAAISRDVFVKQLTHIAGVRIVKDDMREYDAEEQERLEQLAFRQALDSIDIARVAFERGSTSLTSSSKDVLLELAQLLRNSPIRRVRIAGHTDNTGRLEVNLRISRNRANSVADFLISRGVSPTQVIAKGYGATQPIADNNSEAGRAFNRRIEINYVN